MLRTILMTGVALSLAGTAPAQQQADKQLKQQAETVASRYFAAINSADATALKNLYMPQVVTINRFGISPPSGVEQRMARIKQMGIKLQGNVQEVQELDADTAISVGNYTYTYENPQESGEGTFMQVLEKQGSEWKVGGMALAIKSQPGGVVSGSSTK